MNIIGELGEKLAQQYLIKNKYKILELNYKNTIGEIDIIAKQFNTIIFVEVKTRQNTKFGLPRESVTLTKQQKIKKVAGAYLKFMGLTEVSIRFDVIDVLNKEITHIQNAF